jgi:hypothetical protein
MNGIDRQETIWSRVIGSDTPQGSIPETPERSRTAIAESGGEGPVCGERAIYRELFFGKDLSRRSDGWRR